MKLKFRPNDKQRLAVYKWADRETSEIVFGGAKYGGKSFLGGTLIFNDALTYPETFYFIGRENLNDLRKFTVPTISAVFRNWNIAQTDYCKFNGQDNYYQMHNGSRVYLLECKYLPSDPLFERFGSMEMTRGWIEEGGEVNVLAKENLKASIGRKMNHIYKLKKKLLITCNPKKNWLYTEFYKPFTTDTLEKDKAFIQSLATDNVDGDRDYIESLSKIKDPIMRQRLWLGQWEYDNDPTCLIEYDKITDLFTNTFVAGGTKYITADIARYGSDKVVIMVWDGFRVIDIMEFGKSAVTDTAKKIDELAKKWKIPKSNIVVDEDGIGGGVKDILKCEGFVNNASPIPVNNEKQNFDNLKSQCYFKLADFVNEALIFVDTADEHKKQYITEELEQVKQKKVDQDGKKSIQPKQYVKEQLGRSPDYSDSLMMRMYFIFKPALKRARVTF